MLVATWHQPDRPPAAGPGVLGGSGLWAMEEGGSRQPCPPVPWASMATKKKKQATPTADEASKDHAAAKKKTPASRPRPRGKRLLYRK